jgi:hypothetical protein
VARQLCADLFIEVDPNWRVDVTHIKARKPLVCVRRLHCFSVDLIFARRQALPS